MKRLVTGLSKPCSHARQATIVEDVGYGGGFCKQQYISPRTRQQVRHASSKISRPRPRTALFFPGQGVQKVGMLTPWLEAFPSTAKPIVEEIDHLLGYKLSKIIEEGPNSTLTATENAQPAIMSSSILISHTRARIRLQAAGEGRRDAGTFAGRVCSFS